jgi:hypothetical protein
MDYLLNQYKVFCWKEFRNDNSLEILIKDDFDDFFTIHETRLQREFENQIHELLDKAFAKNI